MVTTRIGCRVGVSAIAAARLAGTLISAPCQAQDVAAPTTATATIPVGADFLPFELTTTPVTEGKQVGIKATANGVTKSKTLVVNPSP